MTAAAMAPAALSPAALARARRRSRSALFAGVALGSTGHIAAVTVATIVAKDLLGSQALAGAPGATVVLGAALGAVLLSALMARKGRRIGLVTGYSVGVLGALVATAAVITRSFPLLLFGTVLIGFGNASNQLSRYTAADMVPPERRASAIGLVVWAATIGSVVGPWLVPIASGMAAEAGLPPLAGPYLVPVVFVGLAAVLSFVMLRPDPYALADETTRADPDAEPAVLGPVRDILRRPAVAAAIVALVVGQFVMVLIMTMTPLHMVEHGHDLGAVGVVLSAHTLGMFAFSPLSGWLSDRFGRVPTIFLGTVVLAVAALMAAFAPPDGGLVLLLALFLLGLGWSFGFVAGSAMLSENLEIHERTRVQGVADALIWSAAAAAALGSGLIMAAVGYTALGILAAGAIIVPIVVLVSHHRAVAEAARPRLPRTRSGQRTRPPRSRSPDQVGPGTRASRQRHVGPRTLPGSGSLMIRRHTRSPSSMVSVGVKADPLGHQGRGIVVRVNVGRDRGHATRRKPLDKRTGCLRGIPATLPRDADDPCDVRHHPAAGDRALHEAHGLVRFAGPHDPVVPGLDTVG